MGYLSSWSLGRIRPVASDSTWGDFIWRVCCAPMIVVHLIAVAHSKRTYHAPAHSRLGVGLWMGETLSGDRVVRDRRLSFRLGQPRPRMQSGGKLSGPPARASRSVDILGMSDLCLHRGVTARGVTEPYSLTASGAADSLNSRLLVVKNTHMPS